MRFSLRNVSISLSTLTLWAGLVSHPVDLEPSSYWVEIEASDAKQRTELNELGVAIEATSPHSSSIVGGFATPEAVARVRKHGYKILGLYRDPAHRLESTLQKDFPARDAVFHNYKELTDDLQGLAAQYPELVRLSSIGKTVEGRDIWALHISAHHLDGGARPTFAMMGGHHAREHLSVEVPLLYAKTLLTERETPRYRDLLASRDIWIIPVVNPDGAEFDISTGRYKFWRKNRAKNAGGTFGVDLNRNYDERFDQGGSSDDESDETYHGPHAFSEPETQAIRDFVGSHPEIKTLLSVHTYSELVLYPWGGTDDDIENSTDLKIFKTLAKKMAAFNGYTPMKSSELYIATGDTCDWAYSTHGIFAFTFELSPTQGWFSDGFYPDAKILNQVFAKNKPAIDLLWEVASNPASVLTP